MQLVVKKRLLNQCLILCLDISGEILVYLERTLRWGTVKNFS